jgi:hypothetical protein
MVFGYTDVMVPKAAPYARSSGLKSRWHGQHHCHSQGWRYPQVEAIGYSRKK